MNRVCREVQATLHAYAEGTLPRLRRRLVTVHLQRCDRCDAELAREQSLLSGLAGLAPAAGPPAGPDDQPPELLGRLLANAAEPGLVARAAVPARGAVSGARPALSIALLLAGALAGSGAGYATWRAARHVHRRR